MKRFIITCAVLMCAALLYGAVDFVISENHGNLTKLYKEEPGKESKPALAGKKTGAPSEVKINFVSQPVAVTVAANEKTEKEKKKKAAKREIKMEEFSRAALTDEEVLTEEGAENDSVTFVAAEQSPAKKGTTAPRLTQVIDSVSTSRLK